MSICVPARATTSQARWKQWTLPGELEEKAMQDDVVACRVHPHGGGADSADMLKRSVLLPAAWVSLVT